MAAEHPSNTTNAQPDATASLAMPQYLAALLRRQEPTPLPTPTWASFRNLVLLALLASSLPALLLGLWQQSLGLAMITAAGLATLLVLARMLYQARRQLAQYQNLQTEAARTLDAIAEISWRWDVLSGEIFYRGQLAERLGYPESQLNNTVLWRQVIHPVDRPLQRYHLLRHLRNESVPYSGEYRLRDNNGIYRWFAAKGKVVKHDAQGKPLLMVGSLEYIQERKDLEQRLIHTQRLEAVGKLTGGIAHDFNNILASILGYLELLQDPTDATTQQSYLDQIGRSGRRAQALVSQLLEFSRESNATPRALNLQDEVAEAVSVLNSTLPGSIKLAAHYPPKACHTLHNANQLQRVLINLGINARDAIRGEGTLDIYLRSATAVTGLPCSSCDQVLNGHYYVIDVVDSGTGIDPVIVPKLFEPFFTTKGVGAGSGIGLSVVHGVTHTYDGHLHITSEPGAGTTISLYFQPVAAPVMPADLSEQTS
jgi:PAS domain S-box-containing protein